MSPAEDAITAYYQQHLPAGRHDKGMYGGPCPFCLKHGMAEVGKISVVLQPGAYFHGYFRCSQRCVPGGFAQWFAQLHSLSREQVPGYDPELQERGQSPDFPIVNANAEMQAFHARLTEDIVGRYRQMGIRPELLAEMQIGYNGRYITYPYIQSDGNCYSLRCVFPDRPEDFFWHGDERFATDPFRIFNVQEIERCAGGALFLCEGEDALLTVRQQGYPGVAVAHHQVFEHLDARLFSAIHTVFLVPSHTPEADLAARDLAARIGYKVRLLSWAPGTPRHSTLADLARARGKDFRQAVVEMIRHANAFSPFVDPSREYQRFIQLLGDRGQGDYVAVRTGFPRLDKALDGLHGLNVIGGAPKAGKSAFAIQIGSQMAEQSIPVLYYDFENGRQQIYQRILSRLCRIEVRRLAAGGLQGEELARYQQGCARLKKMLEMLRVVNDRKVTPELMRRHIDFLRHETRSAYTVVVIDSLHKLPFKDFSERRTGIDAWLRQLESIRDELQVSFLVISEITRGEAETAYSEQPHLGIFKGSGDIEYSADNAMVLFPEAGARQANEAGGRRATLWVVASREHSPGAVADYRLDYPFWGFEECERPEPDHNAIG